MRELLTFALFLVPLPLLGQEPELFRLWPAGVEMPKGLEPYRKTQYAQYAVILNGRDFLAPVRHDQDSPYGSVVGGQPNGNRLFPWKVSGGMDNVADWQSHVGIALPEGQAVRYWGEKIEAGARRPLPHTAWSFPVGTKLVDLLTHQGEPFELRQLHKTAEGWKGGTLWASGERPAGYHGPGRKCLDCHGKAGTFEKYGVLLRGSDGVFSWSPFQEGTLEADRTKRVKHWDER